MEIAHTSHNVSDKPLSVLERFKADQLARDDKKNSISANLDAARAIDNEIRSVPAEDSGNNADVLA